MAYSARLSLAANLVLVLALASPALAATERTHSTPHCAGIEPEECQLFGWQPPVNLTPITSDRRSVPFVYARVITPRAPVYRHPADAGAGSLPARTLGAGFIYVSVTAQAVYGGREYYQINRGEFMAASDLELVRPSSFSGVFFSTPPALPSGWAVTGDWLRSAPGAPAAPDSPYIGRYQAITIHSAQRLGEWDWYQVGPDQWLEQRNVAVVQPQPAASGLSGRWIEVNLYEQTAAAFENGRLVFATLTSTGLSAWSTRLGLFQIWAMQNQGRQTGAYRRDKSDYYFLEDVPWVMYFDGDISLHGAYWHDGFGFRRSHGCVNLAPADARWFFSWASLGTPVYVYDSRNH